MKRTIEEIIDDLKFVTGQDSLTNARAIKLLNYAKDNYSYIALTASGRWKFDDYTHTNDLDEVTYPIATSTISPIYDGIPLETGFLAINQVQVYVNGRWQTVQPIDTRDNKHEVLGTTYASSGTPMYYDYDAHSLFVYPKPATSTPIKILYSRAGKHFTESDLTQYTGIPSIHDEYLIIHSGYKLSFRTVDGAKVDFRNELAKWEGVDGKGGIIRDFYSKRDQDTPRRLKGMTPTAFTGTSRGKGRRSTGSGISGLI